MAERTFGAGVLCTAVMEEWIDFMRETRTQRGLKGDECVEMISGPPFV